MTFRQRLFTSYYLGVSQGNATDAARRAGYRWPDKAGPKLVGKSSIRAAIEAKLSSVTLSQDEILARLADMATADLLEFVDGNDAGDARVNLKRARRRGNGWLLKRIKTSKGEMDVELESKLAALFKLGEYYGMWNREAPPELSLAELAKKLKARLEQSQSRGES